MPKKSDTVKSNNTVIVLCYILRIAVPFVCAWFTYLSIKLVQYKIVLAVDVLICATLLAYCLFMFLKGKQTLRWFVVGVLLTVISYFILSLTISWQTQIPTDEELSTLVDYNYEQLINMQASELSYITLVGTVDTVTESDTGVTIDFNSPVTSFTAFFPYTEYYELPEFKQGNSVVLEGVLRLNYEGHKYFIDQAYPNYVGKKTLPDPTNVPSASNATIQYSDGVLTDGMYLFNEKGERTRVLVSDGVYWNGRFYEDESGNLTRLLVGDNTYSDGIRFYDKNGIMLNTYAGATYDADGNLCYEPDKIVRTVTIPTGNGIYWNGGNYVDKDGNILGSDSTINE